MAGKRAETVPLLVKDVDGVRDGVQDALERGEETTPNGRRVGVAAFVTAVMWFWMNIANNIALQEFRDEMGYDAATRGDGIGVRLRAMMFVTTTQMSIGTALVLCVKAFSRKGESFREMWRGNDGVEVGARCAALRRVVIHE